VAGWKSIYEQLKDRRVIRSSVLYLALFWGAVEVADLLAGADIISEDKVRWLLFGGVVGFPIVLALSWFFESPWKERRWFSVMGDVSVIVAIAVGTLLLAKEQFITSFTRPVIAIVRIEPTDARADTVDLADHLSARFRMLLASRQEIRVIELNSSQSAQLASLPITDKASALGADLLIGGTVNQGGGEIRLSIQLFAADGELIWSEQFNDRMIDLAQLQNRVFDEIWPHLPLSEQALREVAELVVQCEYPANREAIQAITKAGALGDRQSESQLQALSTLIDQNQDNGLLHLARASVYFNSLETIEPTRKSIVQNLAMRDLDQAASQCPDHPGIALLRLYNTLQLQAQQANQSQFLAQFPNESQLRYELATVYKQSGNIDTASEFAGEAWSLNPLDTIALCFYQQLLHLQESNRDSDALRSIEESMTERLLLQEFDCP